MTELVRVPSDGLLVLIKAAANNLMGFADLWLSIKKKGGDEGFTEIELQDMIRPLLKPQLNKDQIYYLFHKEEKIEQVKANSRRKFPTDDGKKDTGQNTKPADPPKQETKKEEEPSKEELDEINKSLETPTESEEIKKLFKTLSERHDGIKHFYYDTYGTNLLNSRIIKNLENSGVRVFKRLYFEV